jgi:hypothetical protein
VPEKPQFTALQDADDHDREIDISAGPPLWTMAEDYIQGPVKLKIEVVGPAATWQFAAGTYCDACGTMRNDPNALLPAAPIGALIGKLGGGTADAPASAAIAGGAPTPPPGM